MGFEGLVSLCALLGPDRSQWRAPNVHQPEAYAREPGPGSSSGWVGDLGESSDQTEQLLPTFLLPDA